MSDYVLYAGHGFLTPRHDRPLGRYYDVA